MALTGKSHDTLRQHAQSRLKNKELNFIFTVDLYNEGVDIPQVDTVLFLRPTESLTVLVQQLGRGLRKYSGKECLTVLDFIGQSHKKFRFDLRFRALQSDARESLTEQIESGFPYLPSGCSIILQREAQQYVLQNLKSAVTSGSAGLKSALNDQIDVLDRVPTLAEFLAYNQIESDDLYRHGKTLAALAAETKSAGPLDEPDSSDLTKGFHRIQHLDDVAWIKRLRRHIDGSKRLDYRDEPAKRRLLMFWLSLWGQNRLQVDPSTNDAQLDLNPRLKDEVLQLLDYRIEQAKEPAGDSATLANCPLALHASYRRDEILAGLGHWTFEKQPAMLEGVLHSPKLGLDVFLITLDKTAGRYSPLTMYDDYAMSRTLFHWQSQNATSSTGKNGRRYIEGGEPGHKFLLFVRERKVERGWFLPYAFLGPARYVSHTGERPMSIVWELEHPMPARLLRTTARLAA